MSKLEKVWKRSRTGGSWPLWGGAVRLGGAALALGLAEGVETALSASKLFGIPCWATLGAERFGLIEVPEGIERDAALARARFAGIAAVAAYHPDRRGDDWNDVLRRKARPRP